VEVRHEAIKNPSRLALDTAEKKLFCFKGFLSVKMAKSEKLFFCQDLLIFEKSKSIN